MLVPSYPKIICKGASAKYWVNTYVKHFFQCKKNKTIVQSCDKLWFCWSVNWCEEKSDLKQFNMQHKINTFL